MNSIHRLSRFRNHTRRIFTVLLFLICLTACCANAASELRLFFPGEPDSYLVVDAQNHWGIQDAQGNWIMKSEDALVPQTSGLSIVMLPFEGFTEGVGWFAHEDRAGLISADGEIILPPEYELRQVFLIDEALPKAFCDSTAIARKDGVDHLIDTRGRILDDLNADQIVPVDDTDRVWYRKNDQIGITRRNGQVITAPLYLSCIDSPKNDAIAAQTETGWGLLSENGAPLTDFTYDSIEASGQSGIFIVEKDNRYGLLGKDGREITAIDFNEISRFSEGFAAAFQDSGAGWINTAGEFIFEIRFDDTRNFHCGYAIFTKRGKCGVIAADGRETVPPIYQHIFAMGYYAKANLDGQDIIIDLRSGTELIRMDENTLSALDSNGGLYIQDTDGIYQQYRIRNGSTEQVSTLRGLRELTDVLENASVPASFPAELDSSTYLCTERGLPQKETLLNKWVNGRALEITPVALDAIAFAVNADNPISSLSSEEIRSIYAGKISTWSQLGPTYDADCIPSSPESNEITDEPSAWLSRFMNGKPLRTLPYAEIIFDVSRWQPYVNLPGAIGVGYASKIAAKEDIKWIALDGVAPTAANIRGNAYPYVETLYLVTENGADDPNSAILREWLLSDDGQRFLESCGYTALREVK